MSWGVSNCRATTLDDSWHTCLLSGSHWPSIQHTAAATLNIQSTKACTCVQCLHMPRYCLQVHSTAVLFLAGCSLQHSLAAAFQVWFNGVAASRSLPFRDDQQSHAPAQLAALPGQIDSMNVRIHICRLRLSVVLLCSVCIEAHARPKHANKTA